MSQSPTWRSEGWPAPGTKISVPAYLVFRHDGIVSDCWCDGKPMVISNSNRAGGVFEEPWDAFTQGNLWKDEGYPGTLSSHEVLRRARFAIGSKYDALLWNCEDLVAYAHDVKPQATQLGIVVAVAMLSTALIVLSSKK